jgi:hypothetical protein
MLGLAAVLGGCITDDERKMLSYYKHANKNHSGAQAVTPGELSTFIRDVAKARTTQEGNVDGQAVSGVYTGRDNCDHVAIIRIDVRTKKQRAAENYRVCGESVIRTDRDTVAPSYPDDPGAVTALTSARRNALLYGQQQTRYQDYRIETRRLGVGSAKPCQPVSTIITYENNLVFQDVNEVCN